MNLSRTRPQGVTRMFAALYHPNTVPSNMGLSAYSSLPANSLIEVTGDTKQGVVKTPEPPGTSYGYFTPARFDAPDGSAHIGWIETRHIVGYPNIEEAPLPDPNPPFYSEVYPLPPGSRLPGERIPGDLLPAALEPPPIGSAKNPDVAANQAASGKSSTLASVLLVGALLSPLWLGLLLTKRSKRPSRRA